MVDKFRPVPILRPPTAVPPMPAGITVAFTIMPDGNVAASVPPGVGLGQFGAMILILERMAFSLLDHSMSAAHDPEPLVEN